MSKFKTVKQIVLDLIDYREKMLLTISHKNNIKMGYTMQEHTRLLNKEYISRDDLIKELESFDITADTDLEREAIKNRFIKQLERSK